VTIRSITLDPAYDWGGSGVVLVTADDIPGDNVVHLIRDDQPVFDPAHASEVLGRHHQASSGRHLPSRRG
jgi:hypothetical protein